MAKAKKVGAGKSLSDESLMKNVDDSIEKVTLELANLKQDLKSGKKLSLGRINFFAKMLQGLNEVRGAW